MTNPVDFFRASALQHVNAYIDSLPAADLEAITRRAPGLQSAPVIAVSLGDLADALESVACRLIDEHPTSTPAFRYGTALAFQAAAVQAFRELQPDPQQAACACALYAVSLRERYARQAGVTEQQLAQFAEATADSLNEKAFASVLYAFQDLDELCMFLGAEALFQLASLVVTEEEPDVWEPLEKAAAIVPQAILLKRVKGSLLA